jgi:Leucine Rich repeat
MKNQRIKQCVVLSFLTISFIGCNKKEDSNNSNFSINNGKNHSFITIKQGSKQCKTTDLNTLAKIKFKKDKYNFNDEDLKNLSTNYGYYTLNLSHTKISNNGLVHLKNIPRLTHLTLKNTKISNEGIFHLRKLENLISLNLEGLSITDKTLKNLKELRNLKYLVLKSTNIKGTGFKNISSKFSLIYLNLSETSVSNDGLKIISNMKTIQTLNLSKSKITNKGLKYLSNIISLKYLNLSNTNIDTKGLKFILNISKLTKLNIPFALTPKALKQLQKNKNFQKNKISKSKRNSLQNTI